jgi:hypothetical protein
MVEEKVEKYEMRIPPGVPGQVIAKVMEKYELEVKQTDFGPMFQGEMTNLEDARDFIVKSLNDRIIDLEKNKSDDETPK